MLLSLIRRVCPKKDAPILPSAFSTATLAPKDDWGTDWEPMTSIVVDKKQDILVPDVAPPEQDFFADMIPKFKQPTQIRLQSAPAAKLTSRLAVDNSFGMDTGIGLGELDDASNGSGGGWGEEDTLDDSEITLVKNEALKQKRAADRERRKKEKERSSKLS